MTDRHEQMVLLQHKHLDPAEKWAADLYRQATQRPWRQRLREFVSGENVGRIGGRRARQCRAGNPMTR